MEAGHGGGKGKKPAGWRWARAEPRCEKRRGRRGGDEGRAGLRGGKTAPRLRRSLGGRGKENALATRGDGEPGEGEKSGVAAGGGMRAEAEKRDGERAGRKPRAGRNGATGKGKTGPVENIRTTPSVPGLPWTCKNAAPASCKDGV